MSQDHFCDGFSTRPAKRHTIAIEASCDPLATVASAIRRAGWQLSDQREPVPSEAHDARPDISHLVLAGILPALGVALGQLGDDVFLTRDPDDGVIADENLVELGLFTANEDIARVWVLVRVVQTELNHIGGGIESAAANPAPRDGMSMLAKRRGWLLGRHGTAKGIDFAAEAGQEVPGIAIRGMKNLGGAKDAARRSQDIRMRGVAWVIGNLRHCRVGFN